MLRFKYNIFGSVTSLCTIKPHVRQLDDLSVCHNFLGRAGDLLFHNPIRALVFTLTVLFWLYLNWFLLARIC